jgi:hypothetical protein
MPYFPRWKGLNKTHSMRNILNIEFISLGFAYIITKVYLESSLIL